MSMWTCGPMKLGEFPKMVFDVIGLHMFAPFGEVKLSGQRRAEYQASHQLSLTFCNGGSMAAQTARCCGGIQIAECFDGSSTGHGL